MSIDKKVSLTIQAINDLTELCAPLTEQQWKTATDCPGWSVQDNISHLVGIENMLLGKPPTAHKSPKYDYIKNPIGEHNEHEIDVRRSLTGSQVFAEWKATAAERAHQLQTADAEYFAKPMMMPTGPGTLGDFLDIRILDLWIHDQDIRRALNISGNHGGPCAEHTIDRLIRTLPIASYHLSHRSMSMRRSHAPMRIGVQPKDTSRSHGCFLPSSRLVSSRLKNFQLMVMSFWVRTLRIQSDV